MNNPIESLARINEKSIKPNNVQTIQKVVQLLT
jgi:hypothetical protein